MTRSEALQAQIDAARKCAANYRKEGNKDKAMTWEYRAALRQAELDALQ